MKIYFKQLYIMKLKIRIFDSINLTYIKKEEKTSVAIKKLFIYDIYGYTFYDRPTGSCKMYLSLSLRRSKSRS